MTGPLRGRSVTAATVTIDTTGLAAGEYTIRAGFIGSGDVIFNPGPTDLTSEYSVTPGIIRVFTICQEDIVVPTGLAGVEGAGRAISPFAIP